jgi:hypothetical protein
MKFTLSPRYLASSTNIDLDGDGIGSPIFSAYVAELTEFRHAVWSYDSSYISTIYLIE